MQATTPMAGPSGLPEGASFERRDAGWRAFLRSWQLGAILAVALAVGLIGIFSAHPFASPGMSERVSHAIGQPASCESVGATQLGGRSSTIYKCTIGLQHGRLAQCFTVSGGEVRQLGGTRELGC
jgi:hypothetical protein